MLVLGRILSGMLLGLFLILVSEVCLADQDTKPFMDDELMITHRLVPLYKVGERYSLVGTYRHYQDDVVEVDRVFLGLRANF